MAEMGMLLGYIVAWCVGDGDLVSCGCARPPPKLSEYGGRGRMSSDLKGDYGLAVVPLRYNLCLHSLRRRGVLRVGWVVRAGA